MVAELRAEEPRGLTEETVVRWVQAYIDQGKNPGEAARAVLQDICDSGLQADLLVLIGSGPIRNIWTSWASRLHATRQPAAPVAAPTPIQAPRRIDVEQLQTSTSLLEGLENVGGAWVRVGDLTGAQCRTLARQFKAKALEVAQNARYYHALSQVLADTERVRDHFSDEDLIRLYETGASS